jgi:hypothetical protein
MERVLHGIKRMQRSATNIKTHITEMLEQEENLFTGWIDNQKTSGSVCYT